MADYCSTYPDRLGGVVLVSARNIEASVAEIRRCADQHWAWAIFPYVPAGMPLDHPDLEPLWAAAAEYNFSIVLHTFTAMPPYAPGGLDTWDNLFLQRSAAHPWCGMRNMASLIGSGVMDRYDNLRIGVLEAGHGWLPHWVQRLDEHAHSTASALPALKRLPGEYIRSGRYFQSIEIPEGEVLTNVVADFVGDDVLMFATDYPHGESWFPKAVDAVEAWEVSPERRSKLYWDNAVRFYARCGL
jgi:predicted TIM-barrel fold metal-dependent hydrolase